MKSGEILPHGLRSPNDVILEDLDLILTGAIMEKATAYIFGTAYGYGIHDIHMNQGNLPQYENGIYEDEALLFKFEDGHWQAVFLAFASQKTPTDDQGEARGNGIALHPKKTRLSYCSREEFYCCHK